MTAGTWRLLFLIAIMTGSAVRAHAQAPSSDDSLSGAAALGVLSKQAAIPLTRAQHDCLALPVDPPNDRLQGPHGDTLVSSRCQVAAFENLGAARPPKWNAARYEWVSVFTAEDPAKGRDARDTAKEEEAVLFEVVSPGEVRAVWHARFEAGDQGVWRSITPEIAETTQGTQLLSVMSCVNGTGGCSQEFLHRHIDGRWLPVRQTWLDQLPQGYRGRIRHGVRIDPVTLRGEAGFYGDADANCCPSEMLIVDLALRGDALVLRAPPRVRAGQR